MKQRGQPTVVNVAEAKARLPELLRRAAAGEDVVIARHRKPVARLVPVVGARRRPGSARGLVWLAPDFDETPPGFEEYT